MDSFEFDQLIRNIMTSESIKILYIRYNTLSLINQLHTYFYWQQAVL